MNRLSIHFSFPEVITCLWALFLLGTSHTTIACLPVCRDVYLSKWCSLSWVWADLYSVSRPASLSLEDTSGHCQPLILKTFLIVLLALLPISGVFINTRIISYSESMFFNWTWSNNRIRYSSESTNCLRNTIHIEPNISWSATSLRQSLALQCSFLHWLPCYKKITHRY